MHIDPHFKKFIEQYQNWIYILNVKLDSKQIKICMPNIAKEVSLNYNSFYKYSALGAIVAALSCKKCTNTKFTTIINVKFSNFTLKISILSEEIIDFISKILSKIWVNFVDLDLH